MNIKKISIRFVRYKVKLLALFSLKKAGDELFRVFITPIRPKYIYKSETFSHYEEISFILQGKKIRGYRCAVPNGKRAMILHGFASTLHKFEHFVQPLMENGWEVLAFDAPAHGLSEGKTAHALDYAAMIKEAVKQFGPVDLFIGHSFGGLAIALALEELHLPQAKIVFIAPATETTSAISGAMQILGIKDPKLRKALENTIIRVSGKPVEWFSVFRAVHQIHNQILWIHDENDPVTPIEDVLRVKNEYLPNIQFYFTKGLGHRRIYKDPEVLNTILHFANETV